MPASERRTRHADHGHAHQHGLAGRQAAGIGPWVQRHVYVVVAREQFVVVGVSLETQALSANAVCAHDRADALHQFFALVGAALQEQARIGHGLHHACPLFQRHLVDLGGIVEAAKRHIAVAPGRQRSDLGNVDRRQVADVVIRHADQLFGVERIAVRRRFNAVSDEVIDEIHTRCVDKATDPFHQDRRRLLRHGAHTRAGAVSRQVNQDVDLVVAQALGELLVRQRANRGPACAQRHHATRHAIHDRTAGIGEDLEAKLDQVH
ncbi:hypothetical protein D3C86_1070930 [compost metagenome]